MMQTDSSVRRASVRGLCGRCLLGLLIGITWWGCASQPSSTQALTQLELGEKVYQRRCLSCHQVDGSGLRGGRPFAADLTLAKGVMAQENEVLIPKLLQGVNGPLGRMPAQAPILSNRDLEATLIFIRHKFLADSAKTSTVPRP